MNRFRFRAWYSGDELIGEPLLFEQKEIDNELYFVCKEQPDIKYAFYIPFLDPDWVVEPSIGLEDKNHCDIFVGDYVKTDEGGWVGYVTYDNGYYYVSDDIGGYSTCCSWAKYEVIGNIHEKRIN